MAYDQFDFTTLKRLRELVSAFDHALDLIMLRHPKGGQARGDWVIIVVLFHLFVECSHGITPARRIGFVWYTFAQVGGQCRCMNGLHCLAQCDPMRLGQGNLKASLPIEKRVECPVKAMLPYPQFVGSRCDRGHDLSDTLRMKKGIEPMHAAHAKSAPAPIHRKFLDDCSQTRL